MKPAHKVYCDIQILPEKGRMVPVVGNQLMTVTHLFMQSLPSTFALALPAFKAGSMPTTGYIHRIFATDTDHLDKLLDAVEADADLKKYIQVGRVRTLPNEWTGPWVKYERFRIPTRSLDRNIARNTSSEDVSRQLQRRHRRLTEASELPFFSVSSKSTGQSFLLKISKTVSQNPEGLGGVADGYGLSRKENQVWLPYITGSK